MGEDVLWIEFGKIYTKLGSFDDAISAFLKAIDLNPASGLAYCNLAFAYHEKGDYGKAVALYRKSISMLSDRNDQATAWNKLGNTYRALRDLENASQAYQKADSLEMNFEIEVDSPDKLIKNSATSLPPELNQARSASSQTGAAKVPAAASNSTTDVYSKQDAGRNQELDRIVGLFASYQKPLEEESLASKVSDKTPPSAAAQTSSQDENIGLVPQLSSKPIPQSKGQEITPEKNKVAEKSDPVLEEILAKVKIYENITKVNPANDRAWDTLGKFYKLLGRFSDAIAAYQNAINIVPSKEVYHYYLGLLYSVEKQYENAVRAFQEVVLINPDYVLAHSALAGLYRRLGMQAKANEHISIAMPMMANESTYNRACFYATCGDTELAIEFLRLALQSKDTSIEWILSDPDLDQIRGDARFQALIEEGKSAEKPGQNYLAASPKVERTTMLELLNSSMAR